MYIRSNNYSLDLKSRVINEYLKNDKTVKKIASIYSVSSSSVHSWIKLYNNGQSFIKNNYIKIDSKFRNFEIRNIIRQYVYKNPNFIYFSLIEHIYTKTNIKISKSTLYNILHDLRFSKKICKFKKTYGSKDALDIKINHLKEQIKDVSIDNIISIDEVSFDTNIIHNYGWSLVNVPIVKTIGATYKRLTMICAVTNKQIIHYKIISGSAKANDFLDFIKSISNTKGKYILLDNAKIHHSKIVYEFIKLNNIKLIFNAPYCPEFNPIELVFSKLKKLVKDYINNTIINSLIINITSSLKKITTTDLINFFNYSISKLKILKK
jgi:transposase